MLPADPTPAIAPVAPHWVGYLTTRSGFEFYTRPAGPPDEAELGRFFEGVTPEDLRFRFLSSIRHVSQDRLEAMTSYDHRTTENFLAYDKDRTTIFATAMLAADTALETAEVAIVILPGYKKRGASWTLLEHITRFAKARGMRTLESVESRDHHAAIELEREMGFKAFACPDDATLVVVRADLTTAPF
ncbi:MAG: GNAT family N-acetyltransferase [Rhizobiaceae bacterium]|nr:MAG: GNAT family N-acetyltransferase [Rhizobiaceae bacterium]